MAQGKKISELTELSSVTDNDEFLFVDKEGSGANSGVGGSNVKIKFSDLKMAITDGMKGEPGMDAEKGQKGEVGDRGIDGGGAAYFDQSPTDGDSIYYMGSGNLGLGTDSPTKKLSIKGDVAVIKNDSASQMSISNNKLQVQTPGVGYENLLLNPSGGNVGIGNQTPNEALRITAGSNARIMGFEAPLNDSTNQLIARLMGETNGSNYANSKISFDMVSTDGTVYEPTLTLLSGGKVGIGTNNPQAPTLHTVTNDTYNQVIIETKAPAAAAGYQLLTPDGKWILENRSLLDDQNQPVTDTSDFTIRQSGGDNPGEKFVVQHTTGYVGIGTNNPRRVLDIDAKDKRNVLRLISSASDENHPHYLTFARHPNSKSISAIGAIQNVGDAYDADDNIVGYEYGRISHHIRNYSVGNTASETRIYNKKWYSNSTSPQEALGIDRDLRFTGAVTNEYILVENASASIASGETIVNISGIEDWSKVQIEGWDSSANVVDNFRGSQLRYIKLGDDVHEIVRASFDASTSTFALKSPVETDYNNATLKICQSYSYKKARLIIAPTDHARRNQFDSDVGSEILLQVYQGGDTTTNDHNSGFASIHAVPAKELRRGYGATDLHFSTREAAAYQTLGYTTNNSHEAYKLNPAMVIKYNDNIGIGTTNPGAKLEIAQSDGFANDGIILNYRPDIYPNQYKSHIYHGGDGNLILESWAGSATTAGDILLAPNGGNVGIGGDPSIARFKVIKDGGGNDGRVLSYYQTFEADTVGSWQALLNVSSYENAQGEESLNQRGVSIGTHSNSNGRCGTLHLSTANGATNYYLWVDDNGQWRTSGNNLNIGNLTSTVVGDQSSDERLKNIEDKFEYGLDSVMKLKPIAFKFKNDDKRQLGFGAQTTQSIVPESVYDSGDCIDGYDMDGEHEIPRSEDTKLAMQYVQLIPVLTKAIQELKAEVDALKNK